MSMNFVQSKTSGAVTRTSVFRDGFTRHHGQMATPEDGANDQMALTFSRSSPRVSGGTTHIDRSGERDFENLLCRRLVDRLAPCSASEIYHFLCV